MTYHSVEEIYQAIDETRARLLARAQTLDAAQASFRPDETSWTVAEVVEHLSLIESGLCRLIGGLVAQAEDRKSVV